MPRGQNFYYQNPAGAIGESLGRALRWDRKQARAASATQPPVPGGRKAPDGLWHQEISQNADGSPQYLGVDK